MYRNIAYFIIAIVSLQLSALEMKAKDGYFRMGFGPQMGFTQNVSTYNGYDKGVKPGLGYTAEAGYTYRIKTNIVTDVCVGYYRFRQSVDTEPLHMYLEPNELSYSWDFLQALLRLGYRIPVTGSKLAVTPMLGTRFLFYLPNNQSSLDDEWRYVDVAKFESNDIEVARYKGIGTGGTYWTFILQSALRVDYPATQRINLNVAIFWDMGFKPLRSDGYQSEELYRKNHDYYYSHTASNKGDGVGILLGIHYRLKGAWDGR